MNINSHNMHDINESLELEIDWMVVKNTKLKKALEKIIDCQGTSIFPSKIINKMIKIAKQALKDK